MDQTISAPRWAKPVAVIALAFGLVTLKSGGGVLFLVGPRIVAGDYVPFVVWFNFLAGFAYIAAAVGLWRWERWAARLAAAIAILTLLVFAAFGLHVMAGGAFETRTVGAMTLRLVFWTAIAVASCRALACFGKQPRPA
ncbi:MAG: hypothetical protein ABFS30_08380 [Pseudomonadota bacterium]